MTWLIWLVIIYIAYDMADRHVNFKAHNKITELFLNHRAAIDALNKLTKSMDKNLKSAMGDIKVLSRASDEYKKRIAAIDNVLMDPKRNLATFKDNKAFEMAKRMLQQERQEFRNVQKERKEVLKSKTKGYKRPVPKNLQ